MKEPFDLLREMRDGWMQSVGDRALVPGPFLTSGEIALLSASTGWTGLHLAEAVRRAFSPYGDPELALMCGKTPRARKRPLLLAITAGRVPALAARVVFHGMAAGMDVSVKPSSAEPVFAELLRRSAVACDPDAGVSIAPNDGPGLAGLVASAPACVAYGSDATVRRIREARPGLPTLVGPHMESLSVVFVESIASVTAAGSVAASIAADTAIYDQDGCLSPIAVLVSEGGAVTSAKFAELLLAALLSSPFEPGVANIETLAAVRMFEREASVMHGHESVMRGSRACPPLVVLCDRVRPGPGSRTLQVVPFGPAHSLPDLDAMVPHLRGRVQGMSLSGGDDRAAALFAANPLFRPNYTCPHGRLQDPPARWRENGIVLCDELRRIREG